MISIIATIINSVADTIVKVFYIVSYIGKLIVATAAGIANAINNVFASLALLLQIVYEDNLKIVTEDIPNLVQHSVDTCDSQIHYVLSCLGLLFNDVNYKIGVVLGTFLSIFDAIMKVVSEVLFLLKDAAIFVGNTLWLIITFLPLQVPLLLQIGFGFVKNAVCDAIVDSYMALLKLTNFMTDVPLESFLGIVSGIILVRLCVHFRSTIISQMIDLHWSVIRKILYLYYTLYNYVTDSEVRVIAHMANGQSIETRDSDLSVNNENEDNGSADALCIICQERQKCVLTLPCRHVCLCAECCRRLYGYQRTCPICRTFIYHSVTVYL
ncbi:uncharacterized protein LOC135072509 [Ostrinia nubilalis]|uniref:uncharacterized protein LOC135072509 n=1 Tax=Ostrinia nubilalis TaxID=29057 RepID=UPI0030824642